MPKGKKRVLKEISISEISAVDRPAQPGALATIMKRNERDGKTLSKSAVMTTPHEGHQHVVEMEDYNGMQMSGGNTTWSRSSEDEEGHSHPWILNSEGEVVIGMVLGHTHKIDSVSKSLTIKGEKSMLKFQSALLATVAGVSGLVSKFGTDEASDWGDAEAEAIRKAAVDLNIAGLLPEEGPLAVKDTDIEKSASLKTLEKRLQKAEKIAELSAVQKSHYDSLAADEQDAFLALDAAGRDSAVAKANDEDPVIADIDGVQVRKSSDPALVAMAKRLQKMERDAAIQKKETRDALIAKNVSQFENLPGSDEVKKALVGAIMDIENADIQKQAFEVLNSAGAQSSADFKQVGAVSKADIRKAEDKLDELAKNIRKSEPGLSFEQAYKKALESDEGSALYNRMKAVEDDTDELD